MEILDFFYRGFFREILDLLPVPISIRNIKTFEYIYCNEAFEKLAGKPKSQILGKRTSEIFDKEISKKINLTDKKVIETKSLVKEIIKFNINTNQVEIIELQKILHYNSEYKEFDGIVDIFQKVTRELTADEILRETELLYLKIFEYLPIGILLLSDNNYTIFEVNRQFLSILNLELEDVLYKSFFELEFVKNNETFKKFISEAKDLDITQQIETRILLPDGRNVDLVFNIIYIKFQSQESWILITVSEITTLQETNREILSYILKEQELNTLKNRFISLISHEIRTPLSGILLSVDLLQRFYNKLPDAEKEKQFNRIREYIQNITKLIENAIQLEKLTHSNYEIIPKKFCLRTFIEEIAQKYQTIYNQKNPIIIRMPYNIDVEVDEILFSLILNNLVSNAVKYSPPEEPVYIYVTLNGNDFTIKIHNFGEPIPEEDIPNLFTPFFRAKNSASTKGYGLGLSIVKRAVNLSKGNIYVQSSRENGTMFIVTLPVRISSKS
ncbi:MAG: ATP-binding protein [Ignavibacteria bacterium]|nr:ATP-binding protein [Ignavibacteria bacterium]